MRFQQALRRAETPHERLKSSAVVLRRQSWVLRHPTPSEPQTSVFSSLSVPLVTDRQPLV